MFYRIFDKSLPDPPIIVGQAERERWEFANPPGPDKSPLSSKSRTPPSRHSAFSAPLPYLTSISCLIVTHQIKSTRKHKSSSQEDQGNNNRNV